MLFHGGFFLLGRGRRTACRKGRCVVDGLNAGLAGDGRVRHSVNALAQGEGRGLADELVHEVGVAAHLVAEILGFVDGVQLQFSNGAVLVQGEGGGYVALHALGEGGRLAVLGPGGVAGLLGGHGAVGHLAVFHIQGGGHGAGEAALALQHGGAVVLQAQGSAVILGNHSGGRLGRGRGGVPNGGVGGFHHGGGGHGRAGERVHVFAQGQGRGFADELGQEGLVRGTAGAEVRGLAVGIHQDGSNRAILKGHGDGHFTLEALSRGAAAVSAGGGGGLQGSVHSLHHGGGGNGRAGERVCVLTQGEGAGLADELAQEGLIGGAACAEALGLAGGVHRQAGDRAGSVHGQLHLHIAGEALGGGGLHVAGEGRGGGGGLLSGRAEGDQRVSRGFLVQGRAGHTAQGLVGGVQHGLAGHGGAGKRFKGAAVHRVNAHELLLEGRLLGPGAEACGFREARVAHGAAGHQTICAHAQGHGDIAVIALAHGGHAVAHHFAAALGCVQAGHLRTGGDRHFFIAVCRHDGVKGFLQRGHLVLGNGALRQRVGQGQHDGGHQGDDAQDQEGRELLFPGRVVFHG